MQTIFSKRWLNLIYPFLIIVLLILYLKCYFFVIQPQGNNDKTHSVSKREAIKSPITTFLFINILTSPKGFLRRRAMRETWLNFDKNKVVHKFFIGVKDLNDILLQDLALEQQTYGDLIFIYDHKDSYKTLTRKLLKILIWINNNVMTEFVMKVDDDSFVRLNILVSDLNKRKNDGRLYWGFFRGDAKVKRIGPWAESNWYLSKHYLPYALGGGYIVSQDLIKFICAAPEYLQQYQSEDVSLGVWLAPAKLNYVHDMRFDTEYKSKGCNNKHIVSHKQEPEDMYEKYDQLIHHNRLCKEESEIMKTFDYNWDVPPSNCCKRISY